jgi:hypothetical protein
LRDSRRSSGSPSELAAREAFAPAPAPKKRFLRPRLARPLSSRGPSKPPLCRLRAEPTTKTRDSASTLMARCDGVCSVVRFGVHWTRRFAVPFRFPLEP